MKKLLCIIALFLTLSLALVSCGGDNTTIEISEEGDVVVNGVKTVYKVSVYDKNHIHVLTDWGNDTATCERNGTETRNCTVEGCNYTEPRVSNALNHEFYGETCSVCGATYTKGLTLEFDGAVYYLRGWGGENGFSSFCEQDLILPAIINGYPVIIEEPKTLSNASSASTITFMEGWTTIQRIRNFEELVTINIPRSVNWINSCDSFVEECYKLENINVDSENSYYTSIDGVLYSKDRTALIKYACGKKETHFKIPIAAKNIGNYAFQACKNLTSIEISNNVTHIGDGAFLDCDNLTEIYYSGTEEEWNRIAISYYGNECLDSVTIHYNYISKE